jgi:hypothetical protein
MINNPMAFKVPYSQQKLLVHTVGEGYKLYLVGQNLGRVFNAFYVEDIHYKIASLKVENSALTTSKFSAIII